MEQIKAPPAVAPLLLLAFAVSGCAGNEPRPAAANLAVAEASIQQAERADAERWAPNELSSARENLRRAEEAQEEGEDEIAARFATRAELDAELAAATADNRQARNAVEELRASLETLRRETLRGSGGAPAGGSVTRPVQ